jgi:hypothetical protein
MALPEEAETVTATLSGPEAVTVATMYLPVSDEVVVYVEVVALEIRVQLESLAGVVVL